MAVLCGVSFVFRICVMSSTEREYITVELHRVRLPGEVEEPAPCCLVTRATSAPNKGEVPIGIVSALCGSRFDSCARYARMRPGAPGRSAQGSSRS